METIDNLVEQSGRGVTGNNKTVCPVGHVNTGVGQIAFVAVQQIGSGWHTHFNSLLPVKLEAAGTLLHSSHCTRLRLKQVLGGSPDFHVIGQNINFAHIERQTSVV